MKLIKYFEFNQGDLDAVKSFRVKDELNPKIWTDFEINSEVREDLLKIAQDFYGSTDLQADVDDIILTGSLSNYNWSEKYSDYDLHILINFTQVNESVELVKKYADSVKKIWNDAHDIKIKGYEVEVYIQDVSEPHTSTGVFSLLNNKWKVKPERVEFEPDEDMIEEKGKSVMMLVDDLEEEVDELSLGNLVFKLLRRNGYIEKIMKLKKKSYDKQFK